jgi:hypothetical protein
VKPALLVMKPLVQAYRDVVGSRALFTELVNAEVPSSMFANVRTVPVARCP